ncbi:MAG: hypothetical protein OXR67_00070 [Chloroflexota bacterium]|nr:hypothetical protein [Chloroflexota bacterium]
MTPRRSMQQHLLWLTLLASLTLLLIACGNASDEEVDSRQGSPSSAVDQTARSITDSPGKPQGESAAESSLQLERASAADNSPADTDREALMALYDATGGPTWHSSETWASANPFSEWAGVSTDAQGRVTGLIITDNGLEGKLPPELGNLSNLEDLTLIYNRLNGGIPPELGQLANLRFLELTDNELTGEIPPELGNLAKLETLRLGENQLQGNIPPTLGNLAALEALEVNNNQLNGGIPAELGQLASLRSLVLNRNKLSGEIPQEMNNLRNLILVLIEDNELTGCIPEGWQPPTLEADIPPC